MKYEIAFKQTLESAPIIAIVRGAAPVEILNVAEAVISSGIRLIEVTMNSWNRDIANSFNSFSCNLI